ncbi:hypothetical protein JXX18_18030, partial [Ruthenibacterium lactatiformans]|uniref:hypothetical protein n=1 Tax=Ruthenibacterium lactatiformans TaxID=1550024 RepID=UPI0019678A41
SSRILHTIGFLNLPSPIFEALFFSCTGDYGAVTNKAATYNGNDTLDHPSEDVDKLYKATVLVDGLRLRPYPKADDFNANDAIATLVKGKVYDLKQTRNGWAFLLTDEGSGGWACIEDSNGKYLDIKEV